MTSQKKTPALSKDQRQLLSYWRSKRDGAPLPKRSDIHPKDLIFCLAQLSIIERSEDGFIFRLTGSSVRDILGAEFRGRPVSDIRQPIAAWSAALERSLRESLPMYGMKPLTGARGHTWMRLPMTDPVGNPTLLLCYDKIVRFDRYGVAQEQSDMDDLQGNTQHEPSGTGMSLMRPRFAA